MLIDLVIPTIPKDFERNVILFPYLFRYLPIKRLVFIGPDALLDKIAEYEESILKDVDHASDESISFINENDLISFDHVKQIIMSKLSAAGFRPDANSRYGWYYQQFLKLAYSIYCPDDYYLIWDSDTIPLHKIDLFDSEGKPYFDMKVEYNSRYFRTISTLFDGLGKIVQKSFISEHMVFNSKLTVKMLEDIVDNQKLPGTTFYEKILWAIDLNDIAMGFSEFETFGTYVTRNFPDAYTFRDWKSLRPGGVFFKPEEFSDEDRQWVGKDYHAITFESYNEYFPDLAEFFHDPVNRSTMSAREIYKIVYDSGLFQPSRNVEIAPM